MEKSNNNVNYFTGIGSRETPKSLINDISLINDFLFKNNYILRSGGAGGADTFFEDNWKGKKEIFLPWKGFNNNNSELYQISSESMVLAEKFHPAWSKLSLPVKKLMSRNICQILGQNLNTPTNFVVCWTKDGKDTGGTGQAIRLAQSLNIPIFNLYHRDKAIQGISDFVKPRSIF